MNEVRIDVTDRAAKVFGADLVVRATQVVRRNNHPVYRDDRSRIDLKYGDVLIEFVNGRSVVFCSTSDL